MNFLKNFTAKNFAKKIIGLSMAAITAFGGFAANAVKFINKTTGEFVEISHVAGYSDEYNVRSFLNIYSDSKHAYGSKYIESISYLTIQLDVEDEYEVNNFNINNYINNNQRLREFFEKNEYKADFYKFDTTYWTIEGGNLNSYKKEAIIFNGFLSLVKENFDIFILNKFAKISDENLFAK